MPIPVVRDATPEDVGSVEQIYAFHVRNGLATFEEIPPSIDEMLERRAAIVRAGLPYLVAELEGRIVGYAYAGPYRARAAYRFTVENSVYVAPEFQGRRIGRSLLSTLIDRCVAGPWQQMIAVIGDSANTASLALHASLGFRNVGTLQAVGFKFGRWVDTVLMQRSL